MKTYTEKYSNKSYLYKGDIYLELQNNNNILPRTKDYICPNIKCKAHDKKYVDREAVFYRINKTYRLNSKLSYIIDNKVDAEVDFYVNGDGTIKYNLYFLLICAIRKDGCYFIL